LPADGPSAVPGRGSPPGRTLPLRRDGLVSANRPLIYQHRQPIPTKIISEGQESVLGPVETRFVCRVSLAGSGGRKFELATPPLMDDQPTAMPPHHFDPRVLRRRSGGIPRKRPALDSRMQRALFRHRRGRSRSGDRIAATPRRQAASEDHRASERVSLVCHSARRVARWIVPDPRPSSKSLQKQPPRRGSGLDPIIRARRMIVLPPRSSRLRIRLLAATSVPRASRRGDRTPDPIITNADGRGYRAYG
jgi:hypothetical protein